MLRNGESVGCLLLGETWRMHELKERLNACSVETAKPALDGDLLCAAQEGLRSVRRNDGLCCVAAEGELWTAALALAAQLCVDRVALITPTNRMKRPKNNFERQIERLKGYACRNLSFCVSEVLVLEEADVQDARRMDAVLKRMCNSRIYRAVWADQRWTNCEFSPYEAVIRFLCGGEFLFSLAK